MRSSGKKNMVELFTASLINSGAVSIWNRVSFTMDPDYYRAVIKVFVDLYKKGSIYRGARMINWDPLAKTALSDEEVEHRDLQENYIT